jgi:asparagine synthetase B (glutamine-hydrolysing)
MCGIAGVLYKQNGSETLRRLGNDLITMLDGCQHRGPDSTGFALYTEPAGGDRLRLRFHVGEGDEAIGTVAEIRERLASFGAEVLEEETVGKTQRFTVRFDGDLQSFAYAMEHVAKVV